MQLKDLIEKRSIKLKKEILDLCGLGIEYMKKSVDPLHDEKHVFTIYGLLDQFLENEKSVAQDNIDFEVLLPAIAWHDIWKSTRPQTRNVRKFAYEQVAEGRGSINLFRKHANPLSIPNDIYKKIGYCINYHPPLSDRVKHRKKFHSDKLEAHILFDLDSLAFWKWDRADYFKSVYCDNEGLFHDPRMLRICQWVYKKSPKHLNRFYFDWARKEYEKRSAEMLEEAKRIIELNGGVVTTNN